MPGATGSRFVATGSLPLQSAASINSAVAKSSGLTPGADATLAVITVDAAATIPLTVSSDARVLVQAAAVNVITLAVSSSAVALVQAAAAGILVLIGNDDARVLVQATEVGSIALVGASTVVAAVKAAAALVLTLAGSSTGVAPIAGQSASTIALVGSGAAGVSVAASAQLAIPLVASSTGGVSVAASAQLAIPLVGAAVTRVSPMQAAAPTMSRIGGSGRARYCGSWALLQPTRSCVVAAVRVAAIRADLGGCCWHSSSFAWNRMPLRKSAPLSRRNWRSGCLPARPRMIRSSALRRSSFSTRQPNAEEREAPSAQRSRGDDGSELGHLSRTRSRRCSRLPSARISTSRRSRSSAAKPLKNTRMSRCATASPRSKPPGPDDPLRLDVLSDQWRDVVSHAGDGSDVSARGSPHQGDHPRDQQPRRPGRRESRAVRHGLRRRARSSRSSRTSPTWAPPPRIASRRRPMKSSCRRNRSWARSVRCSRFERAIRMARPSRSCRHRVQRSASP
jgi:hypothetical protein